MGEMEPVLSMESRLRGWNPRARLATEKATGREREAMPPTSGSSSTGDRSGAVPSASTPCSLPLLCCLSPHWWSSYSSQYLLRCESMSPPTTTRVGGLSPPWTKVSPLLPLPSFCFVQFMYYEGCCSRSRNVSTIIRAAAC
jgi:hypothetical protein